IVQVDGQEGAIGGTSGAAPQWAAYIADITSRLGRNLGNINHVLYKNGTSGVFNDITTGDNFGYNSGPGWDPVTGWGTPKIPQLFDAFKKESAGNGRFRRFTFAPVAADGESDSRKAG